MGRLRPHPRTKYRSVIVTASFQAMTNTSTKRARNANRLPETENFSTTEQMPTERTSPRATRSRNTARTVIIHSLEYFSFALKTNKALHQKNDAARMVAVTI